MSRGNIAADRGNDPLKFTDLFIKNLPPAPARREIPDPDSRGLLLVLQPTGAKSWALRYRFEGIPRKLTIGSYPTVPLKEARRRAEVARGAIAAGSDPGAEKIKAREARKREVRIELDKVSAVVDRFLERHVRPNTRPNSAKETERILKREVVAVLGARNLADITRRDVHELLDAIVDRGAPTLANRTLAAFRKLCTWAVSRDIIEKSPCLGVRPPAAEEARDRVLSGVELQAVWRAAAHEAWPFGHITMILLLTGQRLSEVAGMRWSEIDQKGKLWVIPKARTKNDTEHAVPLSSAALAILRQVPRVLGCDLVFSTNQLTPVSGFSRFKSRLEASVLKSLWKAKAEPGEIPARWTLHDLRRTAASGMAQIGVQIPVIEKVLNHSSGSFSGIVGVYQRHSFADEKRDALVRWRAHIRSIVRGKQQRNSGA